MKKIISILICLVLLIGIAIPAFAIDINAIEPSNSVYIIGVTGQDIPIIGTLPVYDAGKGTIVVLDPKVAINTQPQTTQNKTENEEPKSPTEEPILPKDEEQSVAYNVDTEKLQEQIFDLTNEARVANGLEKLTYNKEIQKAADLRAKEISDLFSHTRPDGSDCHTVVEDFDYYVTGENLIMADNPLSEPKILMDTWMNSEGHRANILLPDFTSVAIGLFIKDDITYAVQIFMG